MKIAVIGGAGFIGSHLVDALLTLGHEILVVDDLSTGRRENLRSAESAHKDRCRVIIEDICTQKAADAVQQFKPQTVYHLAAQMNVRRSVTEPVFDARVNVLGTVNMLEAARLCGVERFVFASSGGAIYGEQEEFPAKESHGMHPESAYGVAKLAGEHYVEYFSRLYGLCGIALRFGNVYGPRQNPKGEAGVVAIFAEKLLAGKPLTVNGDGGQTRDFIYVDDVVRANVAVLKRSMPKSFIAYNVGLGRETSVLDIVNEMGEFAKTRKGGSKLTVEHGPALLGEQRRSVIDPGALKRDFGWHAETSLREGIARTVQSFEAGSGS